MSLQRSAAGAKQNEACHGMAMQQAAAWCPPVGDWQVDQSRKKDPIRAQTLAGRQAKQGMPAGATSVSTSPHKHRQLLRSLTRSVTGVWRKQEWSNGHAVAWPCSRPGVRSVEPPQAGLRAAQTVSFAAVGGTCAGGSADAAHHSRRELLGVSTCACACMHAAMHRPAPAAPGDTHGASSRQASGAARAPLHRRQPLAHGSSRAPHLSSQAACLQTPAPGGCCCRA